MPAVRRSRVASSLFATIAVLWCGIASAEVNADLQRAMRELARAAEGDNRAAFTEALAHARSVVASAPNGSEKSAAQKSLQVYGDIDRFWSFADASPTGSFFDAASQDGGLLSIAKRYPGWASAVADDTLTTGGRTIYPTRETRKFLAKLAAAGAPLRVAQASQPAPAPPRAQAGKPALHEKPHEKPVEDKPAQPATPPTATAPIAAPATITTTTAPPPPPPPPTTTTAEPSTTTTTTTTTTAAAPAAVPKEKGSSVNMIVAIILVIIGVGMAVVLFRASD